MYYRILTILGGVSLIYFGLSSVSPEGGYFRGFVIQRATGIFLLGLGVVLILYAFFKKSWPRLGKQYFKCPKCKNIFDYDQISDGICPKCSSKFAELRNFYQRHTERNKKVGK